MHSCAQRYYDHIRVALDIASTMFLAVFLRNDDVSFHVDAFFGVSGP